MNLIDIALLAFVLLPALLGLWRGMLWPIAVVLGIAGGAITALLLGPFVAAQFLPKASWAPLAGAALVFVLVFAVVQGLRWGLRRLLTAVGLRWVDHMAGGLAAAAVGGVAGAWVVTAVSLVLPEKPAVYSSSLLAPHAEAIACATGMPCDEEARERVAAEAGLPDVRAVLDALPISPEGAAKALSMESLEEAPEE